MCLIVHKIVAVADTCGSWSHLWQLR